MEQQQHLEREQHDEKQAVEELSADYQTHQRQGKQARQRKGKQVRQRKEKQVVEKLAADDQKSQQKGNQVVEEQPDDDQKRQLNGKQVVEELPVDKKLLSIKYPPGFRFKPTDEELFNNYLLPKINGSDKPLQLIHSLNIYDHDPDFLSENNKAQGDDVWYFFTPRSKKYLHGERPDRRAGGGYWKALNSTNYELDGGHIGKRMTLEYHVTSPEDGKIIWKMNEYWIEGMENKRAKIFTEDPCSMRLDDCVLCKMYKNRQNKKRSKAQSRKTAVKCALKSNKRRKIPPQPDQEKIPSPAQAMKGRNGDETAEKDVASGSNEVPSASEHQNNTKIGGNNHTNTGRNNNAGSSSGFVDNSKTSVGRSTRNISPDHSQLCVNEVDFHLRLASSISFASLPLKDFSGHAASTSDHQNNIDGSNNTSTGRNNNAGSNSQFVDNSKTNVDRNTHNISPFHSQLCVNGVNLDLQLGLASSIAFASLPQKDFSGHAASTSDHQNNTNIDGSNNTSTGRNNNAGSNSQFVDNSKTNVIRNTHNISPYHSQLCVNEVNLDLQLGLASSISFASLPQKDFLGHDASTSDHQNNSNIDGSNNTSTGRNNNTGCNSEAVKNFNTNMDFNTNSDISPDLPQHCASSALPQPGDDAPTKINLGLKLGYNEGESSKTIDHNNVKILSLPTPNQMINSKQAFQG